MSFAAAIGLVRLSIEVGKIDNALAMLEDLVPQVAKLGEDAVRLDWLEKNLGHIITVKSGGSFQIRHHDLEEQVDELTFRQAIDSAMRHAP